MNPSERVAILGFAAAFLLPAIGALWKAASLRADMFEKWNVRVSLAHNGLSEKAARELLRIQELLSEFLSPDAPFVPDRIIEDPSRLRAPITKFEELLSAREQVRPRFRRLCNLGPILLFVMPTFMVGDVLTALYHADVLRSRWVAVIGTVSVVGAVLALTAVIAAYAYLQQRLSTAEILSAEGADE